MAAKLIPIILHLCILWQAFYVCMAKRGFILTSPKVLDAGSTEYFTIAVFDNPDKGSVELKLKNSYSGNIITKTDVQIHNNYNTWVQMQIPNIDDETAILQVEGRFLNGYRIDQEKEVRIRRRSVVTFVQTDKPIYKPGQIVRFRVLLLDNQLVPFTEKILGEVWIEDPSGIRVAQWKWVDLSQGIAQLDLPLSDEPVYGVWNIHTNILNTSYTQTFKVEKYVLPRFDVIVEPPPYVLKKQNDISVSICARYTYGKDVDGMVHAKMYFKESLGGKLEIGSPFEEFEKQISGCTDFIVNTEVLRGAPKRTAISGYIQIFAEVTENGTGVVRNGSASVKVSAHPVQLKLLGSEDTLFYFKPGLSYRGKLYVQKPDGIPISSQQIKICVLVKYKISLPELKACEIFVSDKNGLIDFIIPPQDTRVDSIEVNFWNPDINKLHPFWINEITANSKKRNSIILHAWHSPSNSFLQIDPMVDDVHCDRLEKVLIRYTTSQHSTVKFHHQVFSRGRIVQLGSHTRTFYRDDESKSKNKDESPYKSENSYFKPLQQSEGPVVGEFAFSFDARSTMSPIARLLVFYVRDDGEVVADARSFRITHCLRNQVKFMFRHAEQHPGTQTSMLLSSSPSSLCGLHMVDKSIHILHPEQKFSKNKVFKFLESLDVNQDTLPKKRKCYDHPSYPTDDFFLRRKRSIFLPPGFPRNPVPVEAITAFEAAGAVVISDLVLETVVCALRPRVPAPINREQFLMSTNYRLTPASPLVDVDSQEPQNVDEQKEADDKESELAEEIRSYFPETWLWELHKIGSSGEIALKRELPHTITKWVGGAVCVHPKHGLGISDPVEITAFQPFFVSFNLPYSVIHGETVSVVVSIFNYLEECLPINLSLEPSESYKVSNNSNHFHNFCICGERSKSVKFIITPLLIGRINITVYVHTVQRSSLCGNRITSGIIARDVVTKQLLVEAEGYPKEEKFNFFFCPEHSNGTFVTEVDLLLPPPAVAGSERAFMSVTGDIMGPAINGLEKLVQLPVGCGEQNMVLFVPNIFVLDYLRSRNLLRDIVKVKALDYLMKGYQRELRYRHKDGSYSAFGERDSEGSIWLTAFVVKSFAQARRFIAIDEQDLGISIQWIVNHQLENGCFASKGKLLNKNLQGGLKGQESLAPLTAYILISLLESGFSHATIIKNGIFCLTSDVVPNSYSLSLFSYAAALNGNREIAEKYLQRLENIAFQEGNELYWSTGVASDDVEIAGYAILAMLQLEGTAAISKALPIVRWIVKQRNPNGGFVSTQDTVVALQALATYSSLAGGEAVDIELTITSDNLAETIRINETNKLLTQTIKIPTLPTIADIEANGKGCVLAQFSLRYNVENISGSDSFDLSIKATRQGSYGCNTPTIGVCMRYRIINEQSNMAILETKMTSGYVPNEWSIHELYENTNLKLKRHEIVDNTVIMYFDQITNEQNCFYFLAKQEVEIENSKKAVVKLYDYYQPELEVETSYDMPSFCSLAPLPELPALLPMLFSDEQLKNSTTFLQPELNANTVIAPELLEIDDTETDLDAQSHTPSTSDDAVQADNQIQQITNNLLQNFTNFDSDLSFPDGIEGNQPVYTRPEIMHNFTMKPECPICEVYLPDEFSNILCSSSFALHALLRNIESGAIDVVLDISAHHSKPRIVNAFGTLHYNNSCGCFALENGGGLFILGSPRSLWSVADNHHHIYLTSNTYVIPVTDEMRQPIHIKRAMEHCE